MSRPRLLAIAVLTACTVLVTVAFVCFPFQTHDSAPGVGRGPTCLATGHEGRLTIEDAERSGQLELLPTAFDLPAATAVLPTPRQGLGDEGTAIAVGPVFALTRHYLI